MALERERRLLALAKNIQVILAPLNKLPSEVSPTGDQPVLPQSLFVGTRGYLVKLAHQINRCYSATCYDACSVMIRRLIEVLIIEAYIHHQRDMEIKDAATGGYARLSALVPKALTDFSRLSRNTRAALGKLKDYGDLSAHSIRYNAKREYIDDQIVGLRTAVEDLMYEAGMRK
jgi:hypothetical protein